jgi:hypothetical protein
LYREAEGSGISDRRDHDIKVLRRQSRATLVSLDFFLSGLVV